MNDTMKSSVFVPAHITGFFTIEATAKRLAAAGQKRRGAGIQADERRGFDFGRGGRVAV